jgi:hypothetical protein
MRIVRLALEDMPSLTTRQRAKEGKLPGDCGRNDAQEFAR